MNGIEKNFQLKKHEMLAKYDSNIRLLSKNKDVDMDVAWDMFLFNAKCLYLGIETEVIAGGGKVDVEEVKKDYAELDHWIQLAKKEL